MTTAVRRYRIRAIGLALPALIAATSCVPQRAAPTLAALPLEPDAGRLLRRLALDVPDAVVPGPLALGVPASIAPAMAAPFLAATQSPDDANRAIDCLTAAVYYEARSQSLDGQRAVAQVVLNRVRDRAFPASVCGVVYQGSTRRTGCQFSFTCDGSMNARREEGAWAIARGIAQAALGGAVYAPIGSATYYHADSILPWWAPSLSRVTAVGSHIFYRWRGAMERTLAYSQAYSGVEPGAPTMLPAALIASVTGVVVHRGGDDGGTVAIHRDSAAQAVGTPAGGGAWGIKVHYAEQRQQGPVVIGGALVSDEQ